VCSSIRGSDYAWDSTIAGDPIAWLDGAQQVGVRDCEWLEVVDLAAGAELGLGLHGGLISQVRARVQVSKLRDEFLKKPPKRPLTREFPPTMDTDARLGTWLTDMFTTHKSLPWLAVLLILSTSGCSMAVSAPLEPATAERVKVEGLQTRIAFDEYAAHSRLGAQVPKHTAGQDYGPYELAGYTNYFTFQMTAPDGAYTASCATSLREHEAQTPMGGFIAHETFKMHCWFGPDGAAPTWTLEFDGTGGLFEGSSYQGALSHADQRFDLRVPEYFGVLPMGVEIIGSGGAIGAVRVEPNFPGYKPRVWLGAELPQALESVVAVSLVAIIYGSRNQHTPS
jgi:hypothetical protein